jgi:hypothetical protein
MELLRVEKVPKKISSGLRSGRPSALFIATNCAQFTSAVWTMHVINVAANVNTVAKIYGLASQLYGVIWTYMAPDYVPLPWKQKL